MHALTYILDLDRELLLMMFECVVFRYTHTYIGLGPPGLAIQRDPPGYIEPNESIVRIIYQPVPFFKGPRFNYHDVTLNIQYSCVYYTRFLLASALAHSKGLGCAVAREAVARPLESDREKYLS